MALGERMRWEGARISVNNFDIAQTHVTAADGLHHRYVKPISRSGDVIHPLLWHGSGNETKFNNTAVSTGQKGHNSKEHKI